MGRYFRVEVIVGILVAVIVGVWYFFIQLRTEVPKDPDKIYISTGAGNPYSDATDPFSKANVSIYKRFTQLNPNIVVNTFSSPEFAGITCWTGINLTMAGGVGPDILYSCLRTSGQYVEQGFLYPLDDYIVEWYKEAQKIPKNKEVKIEEVNPSVLGIHPKLWEAAFQEGPPDEKRHIYVVPYTTLVMALHYRKDLFRKAGIDRPPKTWKDLEEAAYKITNPDDGTYGIFFGTGVDNTGWHFANILYSAGGKIAVRKKCSSGEGGCQWEWCFNSNEGVKAVKFYRKLLTRIKKVGNKESPIAKKTSDGWMDFVNGKCAMYFDYLSEDILQRVALSNPDVIGIAPIPSPVGIYAGELNATMMGINATIPKRKRDAAWKYIRFTMSDEAFKIRTKIFVEAGMAKFISPDNLEKFGYKEYLADVPQDWVEANKTAFAYGEAEASGRGCRTMYFELSTVLNQILADPKIEEKVNYPEGSPEAEKDSKEIKAILDTTVLRLNQKLMREIDPEKLPTYRAIALAIVIFLILLITFFIIWFLLAAKKKVGESFRTKTPLRTHIYAWLFMSAALISIFIWAYIPLVRGAVIALYDYNVLGKSKFVGLDNFIILALTDTFWKSLINTFVYTTLSLGIGFFIPIILALMIQEIPKGKRLFITVFYLPTVTAALVTVFLWRWFYDPSSAGLLNTFLSWFSLGPYKWLDDPNLAMLCIVIPAIWASAGAGSIIYLAALKSVPEELYEAAELDGAGPLKKIWYITLPILKPLIIINFVGAFIGAARATENIFAFTAGGPNFATHVMGLEIWINAFLYLKYGYATAVAWIMGSMLIGFTVYQLKILKNARFTVASK